MRLPRDKDVLENARALRKSMTRENAICGMIFCADIRRALYGRRL